MGKTARPLEVGIDFDGVLAYNPFRVVRAPVTFFKKQILGIRKTRFYIPKTALEKTIWAILHESSVFPANGCQDLQKLVAEKKVRAHLVTARFRYLQPSLMRWLSRYRLTDFFTTITMNMNDEQPHLYKERVIGEKKFDIYIEDNWDVVSHLAPRLPKTKIYWIYNITDRQISYPYKFPYLKKAVAAIMP